MKTDGFVPRSCGRASFALSRYCMPLLAILVAAVALCGLQRTTLAHEVPPTPALDDKLWEALSGLSNAKGRLLATVLVWENGDVDVYRANNGTDEPWEDIEDPLAAGSFFFEIGNPKICYVTSGGDMRCIIY